VWVKNYINNNRSYGKIDKYGNFYYINDTSTQRYNFAGNLNKTLNFTAQIDYSGNFYRSTRRVQNQSYQNKYYIEKYDTAGVFESCHTTPWITGVSNVYNNTKLSVNNQRSIY
jgi:hypothetical protein